MSSNRNISELKDLLSQSQLSDNDLISMMVRVRVIIEENKLQSQFQNLNLYCNWTVHSRITESLVCLRMLEKLTDLLLQESTPTENPQAQIDRVFVGVHRALALKDLNAEFIKLCLLCRLPDTIFSESRIWKEFLRVLLSILLDKPLQFPDNITTSKNKAAKTIYDSIQNKTKVQPKCAVSKFWFTQGEYPNLMSIHWHIETFALIHFQGPILLMQ